MKKYLFFLLLTGLAMAAADKNDATRTELLEVAPDARLGKNLKPTTENPFRRFLEDRRTESHVDAADIDSTVRNAIGGKNVGGIIPASTFFKGGAVLNGMLFEIDEEITLNKGGAESSSVVPGYRLFLRGITSRGLRVEVNQMGDFGSARLDTRTVIEIPIDDFLKQ